MGNNVNSSTIAGGFNNDIGAYSSFSVIGGGSFNEIVTSAYSSTIPGGYSNNVAANSHSATIAGGRVNHIGENSYSASIGGGSDNNIGLSSPSATIAGGKLNHIGANSPYSVIGGGTNNDIAANAQYTTIAGGVLNDIGTNTIASTIGGGLNNHIAANTTSSTIAGGEYNHIGKNSHYSAVGGGYNNTIAVNADYATIPGGIGNSATNLAFAAGFLAHATNTGAFVWSDSTGTDTGSINNNSVTMRASGGYRFFTGTNTAGAQLLANATSWSVMSDRDAKKNFAAVDYESVLDKLSRVPVSQWNYKWEKDSDVPNIGPMAQDFKAVFFPGRDDKSISTLEFDGVELAAIQGLNRKLEQKQTEITELKARLEKLERLVNEKIGGAK